MGFRRTGEFTATIENYEKGIGTLAALLAEEKSRTGDPQFIYRLAGSLQAHFRLDEADSHFTALVALMRLRVQVVWVIPAAGIAGLLLF